MRGDLGRRMELKVKELLRRSTPIEKGVEEIRTDAHSGR